MEHSKWTRRSQFWKGAVSTILLGWLAFGFATWLSVEILKRDPGPGSDYMYIPNVWIAIAVIWLWLSAFASISFVCGTFCALFWHPFANRKDYDNSGFWLFPLVLLPSVFLFGLGILAFLPCLPLFYKGIDFGNKWWPARRWRQFFGMANDYERDADELESEPKSP